MFNFLQSFFTPNQTHPANKIEDIKNLLIEEFGYRHQVVSRGYYKDLDIFIGSKTAIIIFLPEIHLPSLLVKEYYAQVQELESQGSKCDYLFFISASKNFNQDFLSFTNPIINHFSISQYSSDNICDEVKEYLK